MALPPVGQGWLAFVLLIPLLLAALGQGFAYGFIGGMVAVMTAGIISRYGLLLEPSMVDGSPGWNYLGFFLFGLAIALLSGVVGEVKDLNFKKCVCLAAWGVLFEAILLLVLPAHIALPLHQSKVALVLASVGGVWIVSFLVYLFVLSVVMLLQKRETQLAAGAVLALGMAIPLMQVSPLGEEAIRVVAIQTEAKDIETLSALNESAFDVDPDFIVWPELSASSIAAGGDTTVLEQYSKDSGSPPFVTSYQDSAEDMPHNTASVFAGSEKIGAYNKRKPFAGEKNLHTAGTEAVTVSVGEHRARLNICFDSSFPAVMRDGIREDQPDLILLPTLDPPAPYGTIQALHAAYTPFRAAELGLPIVRADITAYSQVVDANGAVVAEAGSGTEEVITAWVGKPRWTLYRVLGDWFLYLCGVLAVGLTVSSIRKKKNPLGVSQAL